MLKGSLLERVSVQDAQQQEQQAEQALDAPTFFLPAFGQVQRKAAEARAGKWAVMRPNAVGRGQEAQLQAAQAARAAEARSGSVERVCRCWMRAQTQAEQALAKAPFGSMAVSGARSLSGRFGFGGSLLLAVPPGRVSLAGGASWPGLFCWRCLLGGSLLLAVPPGRVSPAGGASCAGLCLVAPLRGRPRLGAGPLW